MLQQGRATGPLWALGAMSGTSLDGVDAALLRTDGEQIIDFGATGYRAYSEDERAVLYTSLGRWPEDDVSDAEAVVHEAHAELLAQLSGDADLVGFHGQTLAHDPRGRGTHQVGDGARLAEALDMPVVWDFRTSDVALGGEGAPLAPFFHFACAKWMGADAPLAFLNLGGVGNITWIDPRKDRPDEPGALLAFDTGPANATINDLMQERRNQPFDRDGQLAAQGSVAEGVLEGFLETSYFYRMPPKSLDRDAFAPVLQNLQSLSDADAVATLTAMCAASVMLGVRQCPEAPTRVLVCGGGRHNPVLMDMLRAAVAAKVEPVEAAGLDGDMIEAQAFAHLAVRVLRGLPTTCPGTTGVRAAVSGGRLSQPDGSAPGTREAV